MSHVHPKDLYQGFDEQFARDEDTYLDGEGNHVIAKADTLEELAVKIGIDSEGLIKNVGEYNAMCAEGWDTLFEKEREFMKPLENSPSTPAASTLAPTARWVVSSSTSAWRS